MKKVRLGVAGLGRIGRLHADIIATKVENAELVAVMDIVEKLAMEVGEKYRVRWYTDYDRFLGDPDLDAVVIATPTFLHSEMIIRAVEKGKDVFTEKPLTVTSKEAEDVLKAVEKAGVKLQVGYMRRFDYAFKEAKRKIVGGEIGDPLVFLTIARDPGAPPGWAADPSKSGGIFLDMLSHDFDMARYLMSAEVTKVYVLGGAKLYDEIREKGDLDVVAINFEFSTGAYGMIHGSRKSVFGYDLRVEVMGSEGTVYVGTVHDPMFAYGGKEGVLFRGIQWFWSRFFDAYVEEMTEFVKAILEDQEPPVTGEDGKKVVDIAEACWKSWREGKPVTL